MKKFTLALLCVIFLLSATLGFVACTEEHKHTFTEEKAEPQYLAAEATCTAPAKYYYSCACGEKGTETFASGNALGHSFTNYVSDGNATCTADGTKTAKCDRCDETDTIADVGSKLSHTFNKQVATEQYLALAATCTAPAKYYYSCTCGEKGTETFASGNALGHSYSTDWSHNQTEHWHAATCGHDVEKDRAAHTFDENKKCTECGYVTTKPLGLELQSSVFDIDLATKTSYLKVANAVTDYDFSDKFAVADGARFDVCTDKQCNNKIASKRTDLIAGNNVFYILVTNGNDVASYTVTLRRRPIYTVTFNANGGTAVETQQVEEDGFATAPTTTRKGYEFMAWDYNFSSPVLREEVVTASWQIIVYNITYDLNVLSDSASQDVVNSSNPTTYTVEDEITFAALSRVGYVFNGWRTAAIEKGTIGDKNIVASWTAIDYKIVYNFGDASSASKATNNEANPATYTIEDEIAMFGEPTRAGYTFTGWDRGIAKGTTEIQTVTASWQIIVYNVSYQLNGGEVVGGNPTNYTVEEEKVVLSLPFMTGYTGAWNNDGKIEKGTTGDITFLAIYTPHVKLSYDGSTVTGLRNTSIKDLVILSEYNGISVSRIGDEAFRNGSGLTSITIPNSVTSIGSDAFKDCSGLISIEIPDSVTSIGNSAFDGCSSLTSIEVAVGNAKYHSQGNCIIETENKTLILGCQTSVIPVDGSVTSIGSSAFSGCSGLTSITIPDSVTSIGDRAFKGCSRLTSISWNAENCTSAGSSSYPIFESCTNLTTVTIGNNVKTIPSYAFSGCRGLASITIPNSVTSIGDAAFSGCRGLTSVIWNAENCTSAGSSGCPIFEYCTNLTTVTIGNNVKTIPSYVFYGRRGLTNITIPNSVTSIGDSAFYGCSRLTSITIPNSVTSIGNSAFDDCSGLTSIEIPDSVTSIGSYAFSYCRGLTSVTIGSGVASIGSYAFWGCSGLKYNEYDNALYLGNKSNPYVVLVQAKTAEITSCNINETCKIIYSAFSGCTSLTSITIPDSVTSIGSYAFSGCRGLTSITIPNSVTLIEYSAFSGCRGLTSIEVAVGNIKYHSQGNCIIETASKTLILGCKNSVIPADGSVTSIGNSAFDGCSRLTSITIPNSVTSIGDSAFSGCSGLTSITIPNSVTSIGSSAFEYCRGLTSVTIGSGVTSIGFSTFNGCSGLTSIEIPGSVKSIGGRAFSGCSGLTSITIPNSVTSIGDYAFYDCSGLTSVTIPDSVTSIGYSAFSGCSGLKTVYYKGGKAEWDKISISPYNNSDLTSAMRYYYSETEPTLNANGTAYDGNYWHYDTDGTTPVIWKKEN